MGKSNKKENGKAKYKSKSETTSTLVPSESEGSRGSLQTQGLGATERLEEMHSKRWHKGLAVSACFVAALTGMIVHSNAPLLSMASFISPPGDASPPFTSPASGDSSLGKRHDNFAQLKRALSKLDKEPTRTGMSKSAAGGSSTVSSEESWNYKVGDPVWCFLAEARDHEGWTQKSPIAVFDAVQGVYGPRFGLSEGWVKATIHSANIDQNGQTVYEVTSEWFHFVDSQGRFFRPDAGQTSSFYSSFLRPRVDDSNTQTGKSGNSPASQSSSFSRAAGSSYRPTISLITLRWGERDVPTSNADQLIATNPMYLYELIDNGFQRMLGYDYEIWTIYLKRYEDFNTVANSIHLWLPSTHPARRAKFVASFINMVPTGWDTGSYAAALERGPKSYAWTAPYYEHKPFYAMLRSLDRIGISAGFPHPPRLYELLTNKMWTYMLSTDTTLNIPPTIVVPREAALRNPFKTAKDARENLQRFKSQVYGDEKLHPRAVLKIGFSWEAQDVRLFYWEGANYTADHAIFEMAQELVITNDPKISGGHLQGVGYFYNTDTPSNAHLKSENLQVILGPDTNPSVAYRNSDGTSNAEGRYVTLNSVRGDRLEGRVSRRYGSAHSVNELMLQEFIPHNLELRLYWYNNEVRMHWWTKYMENDGTRVKSFEYMDDVTAARCVNGDVEVLQRIAEEARRIGKKWLLWLQSQIGHPNVPGIRMDFFVQYWDTQYDTTMPQTSAGVAAYMLPPSPWTAAGEVLKNDRSAQWQGYDDYTQWDSERRATYLLNEQQRMRKQRKIPREYTAFRRKTAKFKVWTMELTELGFSIFGNTKLKKLAMEAITRNILMQ